MDYNKNKNMCINPSAKVDQGFNPFQCNCQVPFIRCKAHNS